MIKILPIQDRQKVKSSSQHYRRVLSSLFNQFSIKDIKVLKECYYLNKDKSILSSYLVIDRKDKNQLVDSAFVLKTSNNNRLSLTLQSAIFVPFCENLLIPSKKELIKIKNENIEEHLPKAFINCFEQIVFNMFEINTDIEKLQNTPLKDVVAKEILHDLTIANVIPLSCFPGSSFRYFKPVHRELYYKNAWSLLNAICLEINEESFQSRFQQLQEVWKYINERIK